MIGEVAYEVELPAASKIHNVFHVSSLKRVVGQHVTIQTELLELDEEGQLILEPKVIPGVRTKMLHSKDITEYLIKWKKLPPGRMINLCNNIQNCQRFEGKAF